MGGVVYMLIYVVLDILCALMGVVCVCLRGAADGGPNRVGKTRMRWGGPVRLARDVALIIYFGPVQPG